MYNATYAIIDLPAITIDGFVSLGGAIFDLKLGILLNIIMWLLILVYKGMRDTA